MASNRNMNGDTKIQQRDTLKGRIVPCTVLLVQTSSSTKTEEGDETHTFMSAM
jgi:hypothetical protein